MCAGNLKQQACLISNKVSNKSCLFQTECGDAMQFTGDNDHDACDYSAQNHVQSSKRLPRPGLEN